ncbi:hypothetical protein ACFY2Q_14435 [Micromonospora sp. NPDC000316]|uniref:hypothetical protein n=1 Tax=Micromonospora sp. NPDC000316 TaxID=3364216 RepID=UPI0036CAF915
MIKADDPTGARLLKAWLEGLRTQSRKKKPRFEAQRLIHPGLTPADGSGFLAAEAQSRHDHPGSPSPLGVTLVRAIRPSTKVDNFDQPEFDALLGALLTFATDRRCQVVPEVFLEVESGIMAVPVGGRIDPILDAPLPPWRQVNRKFLDAAARITSLGQKDMETVCAAIHMHYCATLLLPSDVSGAFSLLVGGIEALAQRFGEKLKAWSDWSGASDWDEFMAQLNLDHGQAAAIRERLLGDRHLRHLKLAESFANYAATNIPLDFWQEPVRTYEWQYDSRSRSAVGGTWSEETPKHFFKNSKDVWLAFKNAYVVRSSFIHAGERRVSYLSDAFLPAAPSRRPTLTIAQLRRSLCYLIHTELSRGSPSLSGLEETGFV